jgi:hypothetical protein
MLNLIPPAIELALLKREHDQRLGLPPCQSGYAPGMKRRWPRQRSRR